MRSFALLLMLSLVASGCIGGKEDADEPVDAQSVDDGDTDTAAAPTPSATPPPSSRPSSRPGAPPAPPTPPTPPTPPSGPGAPGSNASAPGATTVEGDAGAALIVAAPEVGANGAMVGFATLDIPRASPAVGTLVATWESRTPLDASMDIALVDIDGNLVASATGASPLTVAIPGEAFGAATELRGEAFPTAPGVGVEYVVHFALTVVYV